MARYAQLIGGPGEGWLQMTEMLNVTRLGCACAAAALARRSFLEALDPRARAGRIWAHAGRLAADARATAGYADWSRGADRLFFEGSAQLDGGGCWRRGGGGVARVLTPLAKYPRF